jgi:hypothetical protein
MVIPAGSESIQTNVALIFTLAGLTHTEGDIALEDCFCSRRRFHNLASKDGAFLRYFI